MHIWKLVLIGLMLSCDGDKDTDTAGEADTDTDTDTDSDTDTDTDSDTDTDTTPTSETDCYDGVDEDEDGATDCEDEDCADVCVEDCSDKLDNDQDGLTDCEDDDCTCVETDCYDGVDEDDDGLLDCEDDDCVDVCIEDCTNAGDDDQDGLIDCDDDECYGIDGCGGPYTLSSVLAFETIAWGAGSDWYGSGFGGSGSGYAYKIAVYAPYAQVTVQGTPDGWEGDDIHCTGSASGGFDIYPAIGLYDMFTYIGPYSGVDYALGFQPAVADSTLAWSGTCPVTALPYVTLGFVRGGSTIYRGGYGKWYAQYSGLTESHYDSNPYTDSTMDFLYGTSQATPIEWTASY